MKLVVGLGNPGPKYENTRHNVGWWVVDRVAYDAGLGGFVREGSALLADGRLGGAPVRLLKPLTYMNRSGAALAEHAPAELDMASDLLVVVDDVALDVGVLRFRPGGSAGGHNGMRSIEAVLGTRDYARLRVGVGAPPDGVDLVDWVLSEFAAEDEDRIVAVLPDAAEGVRVWAEQGIEAAMNRYNG